ncbi:MAG: hypothetical protein WC889_10625 [Myxococcota bacterium]
MKQKKLSQEKIRTIGLGVLAKKLGPVGLIRFLQQFETGNGDYTCEREKLLKGESVDGILAGLASRKNKRAHA